MKSRLPLRLKDRIQPEKNPLFSSMGFLDAFSKRSTNPLNQREYKGIAYRIIEEIHEGETIVDQYWDLDITGITLPRYRRILTNLTVQDAFKTIMNQSDIPHRFYFNRQDGHPSVGDLGDSVTCDATAHTIIDAYFKGKPKLDATLREIDQTYPITREESEKIIRSMN